MFMAAALLPGDAARIRAAGRPFTEAATRVHDVPQIRITGSGEKPDETLWNGMLNMPLLVLMVGDALPSSAEALAGERPAVVLSQDDAVLRAAEGLGMFPSLLAGKKDLREFYRALQSLCAVTGGATRWSAATREAIGLLGSIDLLAERSRLDFIPGMPLPPRTRGGAPRICITVCRTTKTSPVSLRRFQMAARPFFGVASGGCCGRAERLHSPKAGWSRRLALTSRRRSLPTATADSLGDSASKKFDLLVRLGRRITESRPRSHLVAVPVPRRDFVRGHVPEGAEIAPDFNRWSGVRLKASRI